MDLKPDMPIWVNFNSWAGRTRTKAVLLKVNPKRSKVRYAEKNDQSDNYHGDTGSEHLVPNYAISERVDA